MSTLTDATDLLRRTPAVLDALLRDLPTTWTDTPDVPADGWRPHDVLGHLISAELDDWMPRVERILTAGEGRPFDPFDRFAHVERDRDRSLGELLDRFSALRADGLARLAERVTEADVDRRGLHPSLGTVTLGQLLATWAVHDLDHVAQVFAGLAGSHDAATGPWRAYLGIVLRREDPSARPG